MPHLEVLLDISEQPQRVFFAAQRCLPILSSSTRLIAIEPSAPAQRTLSSTCLCGTIRRELASAQRVSAPLLVGDISTKSADSRHLSLQAFLVDLVNDFAESLGMAHEWGPGSCSVTNTVRTQKLLSGLVPHLQARFEDLKHISPGTPRRLLKIGPWQPPPPCLLES